MVLVAAARALGMAVMQPCACGEISGSISMRISDSYELFGYYKAGAGLPSRLCTPAGRFSAELLRASVLQPLASSQARFEGSWTSYAISGALQPFLYTLYFSARACWISSTYWQL